jgi:hypothetical protein
MELVATGASEEDLASWVAKFDTARQIRLDCEKKANQIKSGPELEAKEKILEILAQFKVESMRLKDGLGTVSRIVKTSVTVTSPEKACRFMFENMKTNEREGRSLADALIFTKAPNKTEAIAWAKAQIEKEDEDARAAGKDLSVATHTERMQQQLDKLGMGVVQVEDLSLTKTKK